MKYTFEHAVRAAINAGACSYALRNLERLKSWDDIRKETPHIQRTWARWFIFHVIMDDESHRMYMKMDDAYEAMAHQHNRTLDGLSKKYGLIQEEIVKQVRAELKEDESFWDKRPQDKISAVVRRHYRAERASIAAYDKRIAKLYLAFVAEFYNAYCV